MRYWPWYARSAVLCRPVWDKPDSRPLGERDGELCRETGLPAARDSFESKWFFDSHGRETFAGCTARCAHLPEVHAAPREQQLCASSAHLPEAHAAAREQQLGA